ncbi:hypothetical protein BDZ91DRAFT_295031 [Kalaharituber pfeilii]|nr:hypothetical protein BDZ91DRAFT_295031 [Kalaharituber pfeilii]
MFFRRKKSHRSLYNIHHPSQHLQPPPSPKQQQSNALLAATQAFTSHTPNHNPNPGLSSSAAAAALKHAASLPPNPATIPGNIPTKRRASYTGSGGSSSGGSVIRRPGGRGLMQRSPSNASIMSERTFRATSKGKEKESHGEKEGQREKAHGYGGAGGDSGLGSLPEAQSAMPARGGTPDSRSRRHSASSNAASTSRMSVHSSSHRQPSPHSHASLPPVPQIPEGYKHEVLGRSRSQTPKPRHERRTSRIQEGSLEPATASDRRVKQTSLSMGVHRTPVCVYPPSEASEDDTQYRERRRRPRNDSISQGDGVAATIERVSNTPARVTAAERRGIYEERHGRAAPKNRDIHSGKRNNRHSDRGDGYVADSDEPSGDDDYSDGPRNSADDEPARSPPLRRRPGDMLKASCTITSPQTQQEKLKKENLFHLLPVAPPAASTPPPQTMKASKRYSRYDQRPTHMNTFVRPAPNYYSLPTPSASASSPESVRFYSITRRGIEQGNGTVVWREEGEQDTDVESIDLDSISPAPKASRRRRKDPDQQWEFDTANVNRDEKTGAADLQHQRLGREQEERVYTLRQGKTDSNAGGVYSISTPAKIFRTRQDGRPMSPTPPTGGRWKEGSLLARGTLRRDAEDGSRVTNKGSDIHSALTSPAALHAARGALRKQGGVESEEQNKTQEQSVSGGGSMQRQRKALNEDINDEGLTKQGRQDRRQMIREGKRVDKSTPTGLRIFNDVALQSNRNEKRRIVSHTSQHTQQDSVLSISSESSSSTAAGVAKCLDKGFVHSDNTDVDTNDGGVILHTEKDTLKHASSPRSNSPGKRVMRKGPVSTAATSRDTVSYRKGNANRHEHWKGDDGIHSSDSDGFGEGSIRHMPPRAKLPKISSIRDQSSQRNGTSVNGRGRAKMSETRGDGFSTRNAHKEREGKPKKEGKPSKHQPAEEIRDRSTPLAPVVTSAEPLSSISDEQDAHDEAVDERQSAATASRTGQTQALRESSDLSRLPGGWIDVNADSNMQMDYVTDVETGVHPAPARRNGHETDSSSISGGSIYEDAQEQLAALVTAADTCADQALVPAPAARPPKRSASASGNGVSASAAITGRLASSAPRPLSCPPVSAAAPTAPVGILKKSSSTRSATSSAPPRHATISRATPSPPPRPASPHYELPAAAITPRTKALIEERRRQMELGKGGQAVQASRKPSMGKTSRPADGKRFTHDRSPPSDTDSDSTDFSANSNSDWRRGGARNGKRTNGVTFVGVAPSPSPVKLAATVSSWAATRASAASVAAKPIAASPHANGKLGRKNKRSQSITLPAAPNSANGNCPSMMTSRATFRDEPEVDAKPPTKHSGGFLGFRGFGGGSGKDSKKEKEKSANLKLRSLPPGKSAMSLSAWGSSLIAGAKSRFQDSDDEGGSDAGGDERKKFESKFDTDSDDSRGEKGLVLKREMEELQKQRKKEVDRLLKLLTGKKDTESKKKEKTKDNIADSALISSSPPGSSGNASTAGRKSGALKTVEEMSEEDEEDRQAENKPTTAETGSSETGTTSGKLSSRASASPSPEPKSETTVTDTPPTDPNKSKEDEHKKQKKSWKIFGSSKKSTPAPPPPPVSAPEEEPLQRAPTGGSLKKKHPPKMSKKEKKEKKEKDKFAFPEEYAVYHGYVDNGEYKEVSALRKMFGLTK